MIGKRFNIKKDCADLRIHADNLESGKTIPKECDTRRYNFKERTYERVLWADASEIERRDEVSGQVFKARHRADMGDSFAAQMLALADQVHGQPLIEKKRDDAPAPILKGDKRLIERRGLCIAEYAHAGKVRFKDLNGRVGSCSTRAWRQFPAA